MGLQAKDCQKPPEGGERQGMDPEVQTTGTCFELLISKAVEFLLFSQPVVVFDDSHRSSSNRRDGCLVSGSFIFPLPSGVTFQLLFTHKSCGTQVALHIPGLGRVSWPGGWS